MSETRLCRECHREPICGVQPFWDYCSDCRSAARQIARSIRKQLDTKVKDFHSVVKEFQEENNIKVNCISDRILLYLRYGIDKINNSYNPNFIQMSLPVGVNYDPKDISAKREAFELACMELYQMIRGESFYTSQNPRAVAAGLLYLGALKTQINITQHEAGNVLQVTDVSIRNSYKLIKKHENLPNYSNHVDRRYRNQYGRC